MANFTNSKLVDYTRTSPNSSNPRNNTIKKIVIHHMAGVNSVEGFGNIVSRTQRKMSANYAIGSDGRIGLYCEEKNRSWCTSSPIIDNQAITIETSNSAVGDPWPVSDKVFNRLIELCVDICKRNGIPKLTHTGTNEGSLVFHRYSAPTGCPGPYLFARAQQICDLVNDQLIVVTPIDPPVTAIPDPNKHHDVEVDTSLVSIAADAVYYNGKNIPSWVKGQKWHVSSMAGDRAVLGKNEKGNLDIQSPINTKYITKRGIVSPVGTVIKTYTVSLKSTTDVFTRPTDVKPVGKLGVNGIFTIVEECTVNAVTFGKLKSGVGWIKVSATATVTKPKVTSTPKPVASIKAGDTVKVLKNIQYDNKKTFKVYAKTYKVIELKGDRAVISSDGKNVTAAISIKNIAKV